LIRLAPEREDRSILAPSAEEKVMPDRNLDLVRAAYESFSQGDVPAVLGTLAPDVVWSVPPPLPQAGEAHGPEEVGAFFQKLVGIWEGLDIQVDDFVASGNRVCVIGRGSGKVDGQETGYGFVHCWTLEDGLATRFDEYAAPGPELL
jgi:ketosteroid isomerase-like protein